MLSFAKRTAINPSPIRAVFARIPVEAERLSKSGIQLIDLSIGQPHIEPNPIVIQRLDKDASVSAAHKLGYSATSGEPEALDAIVRLYRQYYPRVQYTTNEVMVTNGASGALSNVFSALVEKPDDIILTFEPFFAAYTGQIAEWNGTLNMIPTHQQDFRPTAASLREALTRYPTTRALLLNYPNNPSGVSLTQGEISELLDVLKEFPTVWVIIDDVYRDFNTRQHVTILDLAPEFKDRSIVINSGAKGLIGAPGYRIGMIAAPEGLIKAMIPRQINGLASVPHYTQRALVHSVDVFLEDPKNQWQTNARQEYRSNVMLASSEFKSQGFKIAAQSEGGFYLLVDAGHLIGKKIPDSGKLINNDIDIANYFLEKAGVAMVPASGFGVDTAKGYLRVSCAKSKEQLVEASSRMGQAASILVSEPQPEQMIRCKL